MNDQLHNHDELYDENDVEDTAPEHHESDIAQAQALDNALSEYDALLHQRAMMVLDAIPNFHEGDKWEALTAATEASMEVERMFSVLNDFMNTYRQNLNPENLSIPDIIHAITTITHNFPLAFGVWIVARYYGQTGGMPALYIED